MSPNPYITQKENPMPHHDVTLSNGQQIRLEEGQDCLHIASLHEDEVDGYICEINANGTLVYPNSGWAGEQMVKGLESQSVIDMKVRLRLDPAN